MIHPLSRASETMARPGVTDVQWSGFEVGFVAVLQIAFTFSFRECTLTWRKACSP